MINPSLYYPIYIYTLLFISILYAVSIKNKSIKIIRGNTNNILVGLYIFIFIIFIGLRPISELFGDTINYAIMYENFIIGAHTFNPTEKELFYEWLQYVCSLFLNTNEFFLVLEILYIVPILWACYLLAPKHYLLYFIFCMGAFSFFSYGTNGLRNGMACSFIIAGLSCIHKNTIYKVFALLLMVLAFYSHRSTALPIICIGIALLIKNPRYIMIFWIASIFISLIAGGPIESFFSSLGFDDRMDSYSSKNIDASVFSSTGFRWDFLLYSSMPIILGYYVLFIKKVRDKNYLLLLNTYILCNSFWVMMIRASFSNRFAYLSWFMYAIVLAYPCLKLPIWKDQGKKTAIILMAHIGFTLFMYLFF